MALTGGAATVAAVLAAATVAALAGGLEQDAPPRIHTLFSVECQDYFDWQTVGLIHSFRKARQPGPITRLLSCTADERRRYRGMDLAPTFEVPSMSRHPRTGDWYPAINKPAGVLHWLKHSKDAENVDWVVILDADMIIRGPIIPWELGAEKGKPVAAYYGNIRRYIGNEGNAHARYPEAHAIWDYYAHTFILIACAFYVLAVPEKLHRSVYSDGLVIAVSGATTATSAIYADPGIGERYIWIRFGLRFDPVEIWSS